ncbi:hypothetical protein BD311DRAFT_464417 [Dichomitus squalens]|uniref:Uncharacterized protein n=1 Tax=Dichomitus squalens TaxID=114155 RepID=A0A4V2JZQ6_9APHY|nr:hypothetical protein BD311DRAFT_464417 [Dichomitus squalens]
MFCQRRHRSCQKRLDRPKQSKLSPHVLIYFPASLLLAHCTSCSTTVVHRSATGHSVFVAPADHRRRLRIASLIPQAQPSTHTKPKLPRHGKQDYKTIESDRGHRRGAQIGAPTAAGVPRRSGSSSLAASATILRGGGEVDDPLAWLASSPCGRGRELALCPETSPRLDPRLLFVEPRPVALPMRCRAGRHVVCAAATNHCRSDWREDRSRSRDCRCHQATACRG